MASRARHHNILLLTFHRQDHRPDGMSTSPPCKPTCAADCILCPDFADGWYGRPARAGDVVGEQREFGVVAHVRTNAEHLTVRGELDDLSGAGWRRVRRRAGSTARKAVSEHGQVTQRGP